MKTHIRIIAQEIDSNTDKLIKEHSIYEKTASAPTKINNLGFSHKEQIEILQQSQEALLKAQIEKLNEKNTLCPQCHKKATKKGKFDSDFHAVFTDHKITLQRTRCTCGWQSKISIDATFDSALHPDLVEMQTLMGSDQSFKKVENMLHKKCCNNRSINSHSRIQKMTNQVGKLLSEIKKESEWSKASKKANELIFTIDGGHIQSKITDKRSFEAITAIIFKPEQLVKKDKHHAVIKNKTVVASAKQDHQTSIKTFAKQACKKQGMTKKTKMTALSDGAKNCWTVIDSLDKECQKTTKILDWFHIGKKFKNVSGIIPEHLVEEYDKAKWCLWHNDVEKSLGKLLDIQESLDKGKRKLGTLITYIKNNKTYIVNYQKRRDSGLVFTSQLAESTVNNVINERQGHDKRMQWSREGADAVLQIRSSVKSNDWVSDWKAVQKKMYREAA